MSALEDVNTAIATLNTVVTELSAPVTESTADLVLAAVLPVITTAGLVSVFGADALSTALTAEGYTVTPPEAESASEDATDTTPDATNPAA